MDINQLITNVEKKLRNNISVEKIVIQDKSFLHKNHKTYEEGKFHLKILITSSSLKNLNKIESTKKIYKILARELKTYIHSIQILIS